MIIFKYESNQKLVYVELLQNEDFLHSLKDRKSEVKAEVS